MKRYEDTSVDNLVKIVKRCRITENYMEMDDDDEGNNDDEDTDL